MNICERRYYTETQINRSEYITISCSLLYKVPASYRLNRERNHLNKLFYFNKEMGTEVKVTP